MDINEYIWSIWDIAKANDADIGVGKDMFISNLDQRAAAYPGADQLDYATLGADWAAMTAEDQSSQLGVYHRVTAAAGAGGQYEALEDARRSGDQEAFFDIVEGAVAALDAHDGGR